MLKHNNKISNRNIEKCHNNLKEEKILHISKSYKKTFQVNTIFMVISFRPLIK